ncbi:MAG: hypothetical protein ACOYOS_08070 [Syntrophales bacterium]
MNEYSLCLWLHFHNDRQGRNIEHRQEDPRPAAGPLSTPSPSGIALGVDIPRLGLLTSVILITLVRLLGNWFVRRRLLD